MGSEISLFGDSPSHGLVAQPRSRAVAKQTQRSADVVLGRAELANTMDQARAGLTYAALNNVATLVGTAEQLMQVAPAGQQYYELLINAYGMGAANAIARFQ